MKITNPYLRNLLFETKDIPRNPLVHIFLYVTLAFGISFMFLADPTGASGTFLYKLTLAQLSPVAISVWGLAAIAAAIVNIIAYMFRQKWIGQTACYFGWAVWAFAFFIYAQGGFWFGALVISLPNLLFWTWQFVHVGRYHKMFHSGVNPVPRHRTKRRKGQ